MRFKINKATIKQKGFSLIELILVLGIASIAFLGIISYTERLSQKMKAEAAGEQFKEIGNALGNYISRESANLLSCIPAGGVIENVPLGILYSSSPTPVVVGSCSLNNRQILAGGVTTKNLFGSQYYIAIQNTASNSLGAIVMTKTPVLDPGSSSTNPRYDWIGYAINKAGPQSGMTILAPTVMTGMGGGWTLSSAVYPGINSSGLFGYRVGYQGSYDDIYLRLDGAYPMRGNINMGNYSINNATDINFNGWLNGNNALLNNLKSGYISNSGNIDTNTMTVTNSINTGGAETKPRPTSTAGQTDYMRTWDLFVNGRITTGTGTSVQASIDNSGLITANNIKLTTVNCAGTGGGGSGLTAAQITTLKGSDCTTNSYNGMLTDRLPQYVSKGSLVVGDGDTVTKPSCNAAGGTSAARIIVTPQIQNTYGEYDVNSDLTVFANGTYQITTNRTQFTSDQIQVYAIDNGATWTVRMTSAMAQKYGATPGYKGLAQTFCDFGG